MDVSVYREASPDVWPGRSYPLGATWDGRGVNFALFSAHAEAVDLCLFDDSGRETARIRMPEYTGEVWHAYLPSARPGLHYGYRVYGPYDPRAGHRFNHHKLLLDPYAKAFHGHLRWNDAHFGYRLESARGDLSFDRRDNARIMPKCVVVETSFSWGDDRTPHTPLGSSVILETHVKGFTQLHPQVHNNHRGRFAGLASPPVIDYLVELGVTAVELLPIQFFLNDRRLIELGLRNYWGYNTLGFFAPDQRYLERGEIDEFKTMVLRLHDAGIEIILDVVYNHTGEGNQMGPTLSFRGIDNLSYYRLAEDRRYYDDVTGTGNTLNMDHPRVLQMVMDSLRYWVTEMHVDGFRFDLCTTLARENGEFSQGSAFLDAVRQDPVLNQVKMIAEPWDIGPNGYQLGAFTPDWSEWNAAFRDSVRRFWRGDKGMLAELASRVSGSSDIFGWRGRRPWASINFVTAHDGFTLNDLVSFNDKHNEANGEDNRDGHDGNFSWNCGVEGETDDAEILTLRDHQKRNLIATLLLSLGVPMLLAGDEIGHSQHGNNNAYCQDNEISWQRWEGLRPEDEELRRFVGYLVHLRRAHQVFSRPRFFRGEVVAANGLKDITWITPEGREYRPEDWNNGDAQCFGYVLNGAAGLYQTTGGQNDIDDTFLVMMNAYHEDIDFGLPDLGFAFEWELLVDTALPTGLAEKAELLTGEAAYRLPARSVSLFINRAPLPTVVPNDDEAGLVDTEVDPPDQEEDAPAEEEEALPPTAEIELASDGDEELVP